MNLFSLVCKTWLQKTPKFGRFICTLVVVCALTLGNGTARADTLRVALVELPISLGNPYFSMGVPGSHFWGSLYDGLTAVAVDGTIQPALARDWSQVSPNVWTFTLRDDVTFHNGRTFDTGSVIGTLNYLLSPDAAKYLVANEVKNIAGVRALDESTVEITTQSPDAALPRRLSLIMMIEPSLWTAYGIDAYALSPVGTGPFEFLEWGPGNKSAFMRAYEKSFRGPQSIKTLEFIEVPNGIAREQALISGEVALVDSINPDSIASMQSAGFVTTVHQRSQVLSIALPNTLSPDSPLNSQSVRQALNFAVDRASIAEFIYGGLVEAASQGAVEGTVGYNAQLSPYPYDPARARQLLAEAGYADGMALSLAVLSAEGSSQGLVHQRVAQDLRAVGIDATVTALDGARFVRNFVSNQWDGYDGFSLLWNNEPMRDVARSLEYYSCLRPRAFFCDEAITEAIRDSGGISDPAERDLALQDIMARMQDLAPALWLINLPIVTAASPAVENVTFGPSGLAFEMMSVVQ